MNSRSLILLLFALFISIPSFAQDNIIRLRRGGLSSRVTSGQRIGITLKSDEFVYDGWKGSCRCDSITEANKWRVDTIAAGYIRVSREHSIYDTVTAAEKRKYNSDPRASVYYENHLADGSIEYVMKVIRKVDRLKVPYDSISSLTFPRRLLCPEDKLGGLGVTFYGAALIFGGVLLATNVENDGAGAEIAGAGLIVGGGYLGVKGMRMIRNGRSVRTYELDKWSGKVVKKKPEKQIPFINM